MSALEDSEVESFIDRFLCIRGERGATEDEMEVLVNEMEGLKISATILAMSLDGRLDFDVRDWSVFYSIHKS